MPIAEFSLTKDFVMIVIGFVVESLLEKGTDSVKNKIKASLFKRKLTKKAKSLITDKRYARLFEKQKYKCSIDAEGLTEWLKSDEIPKLLFSFAASKKLDEENKALIYHREEFYLKAYKAAKVENNIHQQERQEIQSLVDNLLFFINDLL